MEVFLAPLQETSFKGKKQTSPHSLNLRYHVETKQLVGKDSLAKIYTYRARRQFSSVNKKGHNHGGINCYNKQPRGVYLTLYWTSNLEHAAVYLRKIYTVNAVKYSNQLVNSH